MNLREFFYIYENFLWFSSVSLNTLPFEIVQKVVQLLYFREVTVPEDLSSQMKEALKFLKIDDTNVGSNDDEFKKPGKLIVLEGTTRCNRLFVSFVSSCSSNSAKNGSSPEATKCCRSRTRSAATTTTTPFATTAATTAATNETHSTREKCPEQNGFICSNQTLAFPIHVNHNNIFIDHY